LQAHPQRAGQGLLHRDRRCDRRAVALHLQGLVALATGRSAIIASVVSMSPATLAAFCSACRLTLVGSMTPASSRSSYWPVAALKPNAPFPSRTLFTTMLPSQPPLPAILRMGSSSALRTISTPYV